MGIINICTTSGWNFCIF